MTTIILRANDKEFKVKYPYIDVITWRHFNTKLRDNSITEILDDILKSINVTRFNYKGVIKSTTCGMYSAMIEEFYHFLLKLDNQITYNNYINKLDKIHKDNVDYFANLQLEKEAKKKKTVDNPKKRKSQNRYYRETKVDMFTNKEIYTYYNPVTKDEFTSEDPNLLDSLNTKKPKVKKSKVSQVPIFAMTFKI